MNGHRPEIDATLDHICFGSEDPDRLSKFFERGYGMTRANQADRWLCQASERRIIVAQGEANQIEFFAFAFESDAALAAHRNRLEAQGETLRENPPPLFDDRAFSVTDPDGNAVVFGLALDATDTEPTAQVARLQHCALRTQQIEEMTEFYHRRLGFVLSDRVQNPENELTACFLRSDHEHHALALFRASERLFDHHSYETRDVESLVAWADHLSHLDIPIHWGVGRHGPGNDVFFMVLDPDGNLVEISAEIESCDADRPTGVWPHEQRTLNLWGRAIMRT